MAESACAVKCYLTNDKECCWSGCLLKLNNQASVVTTLAHIAFTLPCKQLRFAAARRFGTISSFLLNVDIYVKHKAKSEKVKKYSGTTIAVWKSYKLASSLREVKFTSDLLANENQSNFPDAPNCCSAHRDDSLLSWFILFSIENWGDHDVFVPHPYQISQGMTVWTYSYPFGDIDHAAFHNCASKGIISNIINDALLVVDASTLPGSHGAGVYTSNSKLIGIVICPLELKTGQMTGLTVVCCWKEVKKALMDQTNFFKSPVGGSRLISNIRSEINGLNGFCFSVEVVCLRHSRGWGSGVIVAVDASKKGSKFYIATCRHVVEPAKTNIIQTRLFCGSKYAVKLSSKVVYCSPKISWLDFALLEATCAHEITYKLNERLKHTTFEKDSLRFLKYASAYDIGTSVFAKGHCLFDSGSISPTVTSGIISNVLYAKRLVSMLGQGPVLIHSNCTVLDGASGGGIFSNDNWCFYGLVVNNVKELYDDDKHVLYQKINFVLPASVFMPSVISYILRTLPFSVLDRVATDEELKTQWLLQHNQSCFAKSKL